VSGPAASRLRPLGAGLAAAALYVLVALVTPQLSGRPLRPLFDGFAPPAPYAWVNPPPEFARDNRKPAEASQDVALGPEGSVASNATTADGQAIAGLDSGSVPVHPSDTSVTVRVTPLDPATLERLPAGQRAEGNAYQVTFAYRPSGQPVSALAKPGTIALTAAAPPSALLFSADGKAWQDIGARPFGDGNGLFAPLTAPGYYVAVSHNPARTGAGGGAAVKAAVAGGVGVVLLAVLVVVLAGRRRANRRRSGRPAPGSARRRPPRS
jgi:hypothetical protein